MADVTKPVATHRGDSIEPRADDVFLSNAALDNVMSAVIALGSEFWALQKRMNVIETLLEEKGSVSKDMIEAYRPSAADHAAWEAQRERFIKRVYGFLENTPQNTSGNPDTHSTTAG
ncbi:MAG: hypothetical protein RIC29_18210 [Rhodospirillaceae bacterium]